MLDIDDAGANSSVTIKSHIILAQEAATALRAGDVSTARNLAHQAVVICRGWAPYWLLLGRALRQAGDDVNAEIVLRNAVRIDPDFAEARMLLGAVEKRLGDDQNGQQNFKTGLTIILTRKWRNLLIVPQVLLARILAIGKRDLSGAAAVALVKARDLSSAGDRGGAKVSATKAIDLAPDYVPARLFLGRLLLDENFLYEAYTHYKRAYELAPDNVEVLLGYGKAASFVGRNREANETLARACELEPGNREAVIARAAAFVRGGQADRSIPLYDNLIEGGEIGEKPMRSYGRALLELGRQDEGKEWLRRSISRNPNFPVPYYDLALIGDLDPDSTEFRTAREMADDAGVSQSDRCLLHFAIATSYEKFGNYDRAFDHYLSANALKNVIFDPRIHTQEVNGIIAQYNDAFLRRLDHAGDQSERPVFIVGMPRSGTSLIEQILASHRDVHGAGELGDFTFFVNELPKRLGSEERYPFCVGELGPDTIGEFARAYMTTLDRLAPGTARVVDKMPKNFFHLGLIAAVFPRARFIHTTRDPMDTCLSIYRLNFAGYHGYAYDLLNLGFYYRQYEKLMDYWHTLLGDRILHVPYEKVVDDTETWSRKILDFCGLEWDDRVLRFYETERVVHTSSFAQVRRPIYKTAHGQWRRYERQLEPLRNALDGRIQPGEDIPR